MNTSESVKEIEKQIQHAKEQVELGKGLERLRSNRDFVKIVVNNYLEQECIRLVLLKAAPNLQSAEKQASIVKQMDAIGALNQYFTTIYQKAALAEKDMLSDERERELLIAEGA